MSGPTIRVATYNVYLGADLTMVFGAQTPEHLLEQARLVHRQLLGTDFPARAEAIARLLVRERVDVVGLQEVARWTRTRLLPDGTPGAPTVACDFLAELLAALERAGTPYDAHAVNENFHGGSAISETEAMSVLGTNAILVRRDSGVEVTGSASGAFTTTFDVVTGMPGLVYPIPRSWGLVDVSVGAAGFRFVNTHTEAYDEKTRDAQRDEVLAAAGSPGMPVVLVGDFNASPDSVGMAEEYQDAWIAGAGAGLGHTCGQAADLANHPGALCERIDYVWVRGAAVTGCWVAGDQEQDRTSPGRLWPSDHACVIADVALI